MWFFLLSDCVRKVGWECHGSETRERNVWSAGSKKDTCASQTTNVICICVSVFVYLCSCICICIWWKTTENNISRVRERHLREPDKIDIKWVEARRNIECHRGRWEVTRHQTDHKSPKLICRDCFGDAIDSVINTAVSSKFWETIANQFECIFVGVNTEVKVYVANVRHVIWKGKWSV